MLKNTINTEFFGGFLKRADIRGFRGFTLAEVLITLVIIGVIAAMTIPTLINKTNKQEYVSKLKKAYSTIAQATQKLIAEEGNPRADLGGWATDIDTVYNLYKKHLSVAKDCGRNTECYPQENINYAFGYINSVTGLSYRHPEEKRFLVLSDGTQFAVVNVFGACNAPAGYYEAGNNNYCAIMMVDVNGSKGPNTYGQDVFNFTLHENGLKPAGIDEPNYCLNGGGEGCAARVLREGAINY